MSCRFLVLRIVVCPLCLVPTRCVTELTRPRGGRTLPSLTWPIPMFYGVAVLLMIPSSCEPTLLCPDSDLLRLTELTVAWTPATISVTAVRLRPEILQVVPVVLSIRKNIMLLMCMIVPLPATMLRSGMLSIRLTTPTPWLMSQMQGISSVRLGPSARAHPLKCLIAHLKFRGITCMFPVMARTMKKTKMRARTELATGVVLADALL